MSETTTITEIKCNGDDSADDQKADNNNNEAEVTIKLSSHQTQQSQSKTVNVTKKVTITETQDEDEEEEVEEVEEEEEYEEEIEEDAEEEKAEIDKSANSKKIVEITEEKKEASKVSQAVEIEDDQTDVEEEIYEDAEKVESKLDNNKVTKKITTEEEEEEIEEEEEYEEEEEEVSEKNEVTSSKTNEREETGQKIETNTSKSTDSGDKVVKHTVESEIKNDDGSTVTKKETTEITTSTSISDKPSVTETHLTRSEEITTTETSKTILKHDGLTKQEAPMKVYFPPLKHEVVESSIKKDEDAEKRHSLLLERLSVERQLPSAILQNKLTSKNVTEKKQVFSQDTSSTPSSYHYKPQSLWHKDNSLDSTYQPSNQSTETHHQSFKSQEQQPTSHFNQPYEVPPQSYAPPQQSNVPLQQSYVPPQQSFIPPQQSYVPQENYFSPQQNYGSPQDSYVPSQPSFVSPQPSYLSNQQSNIDYQPQTQSYIPPSQPSYNQPSYQQSYDESSYYDTQQNQVHSGYVPPPWVNDPTSPKEAFVAPPYYPTSSAKPVYSQNFKPTKSTKQPPLAYIPPAPNAAFNKPAKKTPNTKTYYSEYERRYISVPENNYVPTQETQPSWVQNKYNDEEVVEDSELPWRKELREFAEKTNTYATERQETVSKPEWQEALKSKTFTPVETVEHVEHPWRKELKDLREQKSYSLNIDGSRPGWCEEQTSTVTRTEKDGQTQEERNYTSQITRPPWENKISSSPQGRFSQEISNTQWQDTNQWAPNTRPVSYVDSSKTRPLSNYIKSRMDVPPNRARGVSVDRYVSSTYQTPYATAPADDYSLPWETKPNQYQTQQSLNDYSLPWENPGYSSMPMTAPPTQSNDYQFSWEQSKPQSGRPHSGYHTLPRLPSEQKERTPARNSYTPLQRSFGQPRQQPVQSRSFKYLQMITGTEDGEEQVDFVIQPPQHSQTKLRRV